MASAQTASPQARRPARTRQPAFHAHRPAAWLGARPWAHAAAAPACAPPPAGIVPTKFAAALVADPELEELNKSRTLLGRLGTPQARGAACAGRLRAGPGPSTALELPGCCAGHGSHGRFPGL